MAEPQHASGYLIRSSNGADVPQAEARACEHLRAVLAAETERAGDLERGLASAESQLASLRLHYADVRRDLIQAGVDLKNARAELESARAEIRRLSLVRIGHEALLAGFRHHHRDSPLLRPAAERRADGTFKTAGEVYYYDDAIAKAAARDHSGPGEVPPAPPSGSQSPG